MTRDAGNIYLYIFDRIEGHSTQDYVKRAVRDCLENASDAVFDGIAYSDERFAIERTPAGKPFFQNCREVSFSVSHSGRCIVCALADTNIGVDIELKQMYPDESLEQFSTRLCRIAERFFHPAEAARVRQGPITNFFEVFTAKECFVKFKGTGFDETLGEDCVLPEHSDMPSCHAFAASVRWNALGVEFWQRVYDDDYTLCVCWASECGQYHVRLKRFPAEDGCMP